MANPPLFSDSKHRDLQPSLFAYKSDPPLLEDVARRAANRAMAKVTKARKEQKKAKKERVKLQRGKHQQGSRESDGDEEEEEEEEESDPNIPWGALARDDEQDNAG